MTVHDFVLKGKGLKDVEESASAQSFPTTVCVGAAKHTALPQYQAPVRATRRMIKTVIQYSCTSAPDME